jgi:hypothetical protein
VKAGDGDSDGVGTKKSDASDGLSGSSGSSLMGADMGIGCVLCIACLLEVAAVSRERNSSRSQCE